MIESRTHNTILIDQALENRVFKINNEHIDFIFFSVSWKIKRNKQTIHLKKKIRYEYSLLFFL